MNCKICGRPRLNRKTIAYARRFYGHTENRNGRTYRTNEAIPVCQDCAGRIGTGRFDNLALV